MRVCRNDPTSIATIVRRQLSSLVDALCRRLASSLRCGCLMNIFGRVRQTRRMRFEERISDMNSLQRKTMLISLVIGTAVAGGACAPRPPAAGRPENGRAPATATKAPDRVKYTAL